MAIPHSVLMVELLMSADRVITAAQQAAPAPGDDPEAWPPAVIVGHLSQVDELVWTPRLDLMVAALDGPAPQFEWWEPDAALTRAAFETVTVDEASAQLLASRTAMLSRLRELTDDQWAATARHAVFGEMDVEGLMIQVLTHDEEHRASLLLASTQARPSSASE